MDICYVEHGAAALCEPIMRSLPAWFEIEDANQHYLEHIEAHPTFIAYPADRAAGFLSLVQSFDHAAEIYVMGVRWSARQRIICARHPSPEYARTRAFYRSLGFVPLEEFPTLWGEHNPCLQLIKAL